MYTPAQRDGDLQPLFFAVDAARRLHQAGR